MTKKNKRRPTWTNLQPVSEAAQEMLREAKAKNGLQMARAVDACIRLALPLVIEGVHRTWTGEAILDVLRRQPSPVREQSESPCVATTD